MPPDDSVITKRDCIYIYIYTQIVNKTATRRNIEFPWGLQPVSQHAMETIITGLTFCEEEIMQLS